MTELKLDKTSVVAGEKLIATGKGCDPASPVRLLLRERPGNPPRDEKVGESTSDETGSFTTPIKVPDTFPVGRHSVVAECGVAFETTLDVVAPARAESPRLLIVVLGVLAGLILVRQGVRGILRRR